MSQKKDRGKVSQENKEYKMKGIFWNSRGLRDLAKLRFLSELTKEQNLDFIALLETCRKNYTDIELNNLCAGRHFLWSWIEPKGHSGGILLGINPSVFYIGFISQGEYYIKVRMRNKADGFQWNLIAVYGAAQPEHKQCFLTELVQCCQNESLPLMLGGDFNIIRGPGEKNKDNYDDRWPSLFNAVINSLDLKELELSGRKFTWANSLIDPTFERLDRVLVSTEWELQFPRTTVQALTREISSDHTPLLLSFGDTTVTPPMFKFELGWLTRDDFHEVVENVWRE